MEGILKTMWLRRRGSRRSNGTTTVSVPKRTDVLNGWQLLVAAAAINTAGCGREGTGRQPLGTVMQTDGESREDAGANSWQTSMVDPEVDWSAQISLMVDPAGTSHIAYSAYEPGGPMTPRHAWSGSGAFQIELVDTYGRGRNKAWVPGSDALRLVYDDIAYGGINFYASRAADGVWTVDVNEVVDGSAGATALWRERRLVLAYLTAARGVEYPGYDPFQVLRQGVVVDDVSLPTQWTKLTTEAVTPRLSLAADSGGTVHVLYTAPVDDFTEYPPGGDELVPYTVRYAKVQDGMWSEPEALGSGAGYYEGLSIAVDGDDNVHATFATLGTFADAEVGLITPSFAITYLRRAPGAGPWERDVVPETGPVTLERGSFALSQTGEAHWVYCRLRERRPGLCQGLSYARWTNGAWLNDEIQSGCELLGPSSLALGPDGSIHVAYVGCERDLEYARHAVFAQ